MYRLIKKTMILGHRGWSKNYPENTILAFRKALELGISGLEFDVQLTADRIPVIIHDSTLDRTTNGHGAVSMATLEQVHQLNAANLWPQYNMQSVPTLNEVLDLSVDSIESIFYNIEVKVYEDDWEILIDQLVHHISSYSGANDLLISSFHHPCLQYLKERMPSSKVGLLFEGSSNEAWKTALEIGADSVNMNYRLITEALVYSCHTEGIIVCAWTVDEFEDIQKLASWGVDIIISNRPNVALQAVQSL